MQQPTKFAIIANLELKVANISVHINQSQKGFYETYKKAILLSEPEYSVPEFLQPNPLVFTEDTTVLNVETHTEKLREYLYFLEQCFEANADVVKKLANKFVDLKIVKPLMVTT